MDCFCPAQNIGGMCYAGSYCPEGSSGPVDCTPGSYCDTDELDSPTGLCRAGYYCSGNSSLMNPSNEVFGDICPYGHYCQEGSSLPIPCDEGRFSNLTGNQNITSCLPCTAGKYCSGSGRNLPNGDCDPGWFCPEGMIVPQPPGNRCLAGHKCPQGSATQTACVSGTYQPDAEQEDCLVCPAGSYCDLDEAIAEKQSGAAETSHGVVIAKTCLAGYYCLEGTNTAYQHPCPIGTFSNVTGLELSTQCTKCYPGYYCDALNIIEPPGLCSAGYYCVLQETTHSPSAVTTTGGPCAQGTYCVEGSSSPKPCPKGTYGNRDKLPSLADCTICPAGSYCSSSGMTAPGELCLPGFFCSNASEEANPVGKTYGDECPVGHYCPEGSHQPIACLAGTYQPFTRMTNDSACLKCDPGKFCNTTGASSVTGDCYQGFYCIYGASTPTPDDGNTGGICPAGSYCPEGSAIHLFCTNGTYTNHTGAENCYDCPEGYYCINRDHAVLCPTGYFCPKKTGADMQPCPSGTYNPNSGIARESQCVQCDGGKYCAADGLSSVSGDCAAGYFCEEGINLEI